MPSVWLSWALKLILFHSELLEDHRARGGIRSYSPCVHIAFKKRLHHSLKNSLWGQCASMCLRCPLEHVEILGASCAVEHLTGSA